MNKAIVPAVALILVVGCAVGTILVVRQKGGDDGASGSGSSSSGSGSGGLSTHNRAVTTICQDSDDKKFCEDTLGSIKSDDPKEYMQATVEKAMGFVIKALNMSDKLALEHSDGKGDNMTKMALDDCKDLMEFSTHVLESATNAIKQNDIKNIDKQIEDIRNWLSMVISFQRACTEGFETDKEKKVRETLQVQGGLDDVQKITVVALEVVAKLDQLLSSFNLDLIVKPISARRLLSDVDQDGFPTWLSKEDRKLLADPAPQPNAVVAQDGSGQFKTITDAINAYPQNFQGRYVIYVKAGIYAEYVKVDKKKPNVLIYGDGATKTIVTGNKHNPEFKTIESCTFAASGDNFIAKAMGFENTAGPVGHQAVALLVQSAHAVFYQCNMHGYQDTLYAQAGMHLYRECEISGTVDFIFGRSRCYIQKSKIIVRKPDPGQKNIVVADGTTGKVEGTGTVLHACDIIAEPGLDPVAFPTYLARPWDARSVAVFMENNIGPFIHPDGWMQWEGSQNHLTCFFAEFANFGPGADAARRAPWGKGQLTKDAATQFTASQMLQAKTLPWLDTMGVPYDAGFVRA